MRQIPILMYHWFRTGERSTSRSPQLEITPELFARQMGALAGAGYESVSLDAAFGDGAAALPRRPVVLTFDDGTADFWEHARPVLDRHGFRATLFVVSGYVGGVSSWDRDLGEPARPLLDWERIAELAREGHEIGSHTHRHRPLTGLTEDEARDELELSRRTLGERLGRAPDFVAYPRGFYDDRHKRLAQEAGYRGACAVILGFGGLAVSDRFALKRMTIKGNESMGRFRLRLLLARVVRYATAASAPAPPSERTADRPPAGPR